MPRDPVGFSLRMQSETRSEKTGFMFLTCTKKIFLCTGGNLDWRKPSVLLINLNQISKSVHAEVLAMVQLNISSRVFRHAFQNFVFSMHE